MPWEKIRLSSPVERDRPVVSISAERIRFNTGFVRLAEIRAGYYVTVIHDPETRRLAFEFASKQVPDSRTLMGRQRGVGLSFKAQKITLGIPWVKAITKLSAPQRRFEAERQGKLWVIALCPAFEHQYARETSAIPAGAQGIYRYFRGQDGPVYIGRGNIRQRLQSPERQDWDFDIIECSFIDDPDQQVKWEAFWIERYRRDHNESLPFYNKISGSTASLDEE